MSIAAPETNEEGDEFDAFGKSVAMQLKKLPEHYSIEAMGEIQQKLTSIRLKSIREKEAQSKFSATIGGPSTSHDSTSTVGKDIISSAMEDVFDDDTI